MSQPIRLGEAEMRDGPLQVSGLRVFGNDRTQASFFEHEFAPALASRSLVALHRNLEAAANRLQSTGVFDSADLELDLSSSARDGAPTAVVNVRVKEKTKPFLQVDFRINTSISI
jgi:outer membrane protein assembly factor BamA